MYHHLLKVRILLTLILCITPLSSGFAVVATTCATTLKAPVVQLIIPDFADSSFWSNFVTITRMASAQYNIDLRIHFINRTERSRFNYAQKIDHVLTKEKKSDYLVSIFLTHTEQSVVDVAAKHQVKLFSFNSPFSLRVKSVLGNPRENSDFWIGHISPNDILVGYEMADFLLSDNKSNNTPLSLFAINGNRESEVAVLRTKGLMQRINENDAVSLLQILYSDWSYQQARDKMHKMLKRFKSMDLIWSASDVLTLAVLDEINRLSKEDMRQPKIASIDWSPKIVSRLKSREVAVSYGGHVFEGAWLLAMIYDHFNGLDFYSELGDVVSYPLQPITADNADLILSIEKTKFNFLPLSKCLTPSLKVYSFDAMTLLQDNMSVN